jgi:hypothetical protein
LGYVAEDEPDALEAWSPETGGEPATPARKPLQRRTRTPRKAPVVEVAAPVLEPVIDDEPEPRVAPEVDPVAYVREIAEEARAAVEDAVQIPDEDDAPPSAPRPRVSPDDEPLPLDDLAPVGTGDPLPPSAPVPMPDPAPEAPDDEVAPVGPVLIGVRPLKALQAGLTRNLGTAATREERLALVEAIVGHPVDSTKDLTRADGYRVLDYFDRFTNGEATFDLVDPADAASGFVITDTRMPPEE